MEAGRQRSVILPEQATSRGLTACAFSWKPRDYAVQDYSADSHQRQKVSRISSRSED
jgi:hypothetical protein